MIHESLAPGTQILLYALVFGIGLTAFSVLLSCAIHFARKDLVAFLVLHISLGLLVTSNLVLIVFTHTDGSLVGPLMELNRALSALTFLAFVLTAHALLEVPWSRWGGSLAFLIACSAILVPKLLPTIGDPLIALGLGFTIYALGLLFLFRRRVSGDLVRRNLGQFILLTLVFLPGIAYDLCSAAGSRGLPWMPIGLPFFAIYYSALSVGITIVALRHLFSRLELTQQKPAGTPDPEPLTPQLSGLSPREAEIVRYVIQGYGNKQIALALGISSRTVGNHIYNLYRKLGISSRFELLGLLWPRGSRL